MALLLCSIVHLISGSDMSNREVDRDMIPCVMGWEDSFLCLSIFHFFSKLWYSKLLSCVMVIVLSVFYSSLNVLYVVSTLCSVSCEADGPGKKGTTEKSGSSGLHIPTSRLLCCAILVSHRTGEQLGRNLKSLL